MRGAVMRPLDRGGLDAFAVRRGFLLAMAVAFVAAFAITLALSGPQRLVVKGASTAPQDLPSSARAPVVRPLRSVASLPDSPAVVVAPASARNAQAGPARASAPSASTRSTFDAAASPTPQPTVSPPPVSSPAPAQRPAGSTHPPSVAPTAAPGFDSRDEFDSSG